MSSNPSTHLDNARHDLLCCYSQILVKNRYPFSEPAKQIWPKCANFIRKQSAPEGYKGRVETIYSLNKNKQEALQAYYNPTKRIQSQLKSRARQAEAKEAADRAVQHRRRRREAESGEKEEEREGDEQEEDDDDDDDEDEDEDDFSSLACVRQLMIREQRKMAGHETSTGNGGETKRAPD